MSPSELANELVQKNTFSVHCLGLLCLSLVTIVVESRECVGVTRLDVEEASDSPAPLHSMLMVTMRCERLLCSWISVLSAALCCIPW